MTAAADPILTRFRSALNEAYGERIERVVFNGIIPALNKAIPDAVPGEVRLVGL